jgi:hypothetical protein
VLSVAGIGRLMPFLSFVLHGVYVSRLVSGTAQQRVPSLLGVGTFRMGRLFQECRREAILSCRVREMINLVVML